MDAPQLSPGWYTDAKDHSMLRFWTGTEWTAHRKPRPGLDPRVVEQRRRAQFRLFRRIA